MIERRLITYQDAVHTVKRECEARAKDRLTTYTPAYKEWVEWRVKQIPHDPVERWEWQEQRRIEQRMVQIATDVADYERQETIKRMHKLDMLNAAETHKRMKRFETIERMNRLDAIKRRRR